MHLLDEQKTALAVAEQETKRSDQTAGEASVSPSLEYTCVEPKTRQKKHRFLGRPFLIYLGVLVVLSLSVVLYVQHVLSWYEAAQPENVAQTWADKLQKAAKKGKPEKVASMDSLKATALPTEEELDAYMDGLAAGIMSYRESAEKEGDTLTYDILCDNYKVGELVLHYAGQQTKLGIFTADAWEVDTFTATEFRFDVTLPASLSATWNGERVDGVLSEDKRTVAYGVSSLTKPDILLTDLMGNTKPYRDCGECVFDGYTVRVPSNYTVKGEEAIPVSAAILTELEEFQYVKDYNRDIPQQAEYIIPLLADGVTLTVLDNLGNPVDISGMGSNITIDGQVTVDALPETLENDPDPLEMAKLWSLFMTCDLSGSRYGFYRLEQYLVQDSYLHNVAWEWATGVDITFTSDHTLSNPPFQVAEATNFVAYGNRAFSCDIRLEKQIRLYYGKPLTDTIYSTFYFVYYDDTDDGVDNPHWAIADKQDIAETE